MIHIDIHNSETGKTITLGTLDEFIDLFSTQIGSVATVLTKNEFKKKARPALDAIIQSARDRK
jgi:hypothetical protein